MACKVVFDSTERELFDEQRQEPGQQFWDVFVGVCGVGDATVLGEEIFHAVERAGMRFGQMSQALYNNGCQEAAFEKYQKLADFPNGSRQADSCPVTRWLRG